MTNYRRPAPWLYSGQEPPKCEPPPKSDPFDEAYRQGESAERAAQREPRSKGGKKRAKDLHRAAWSRYGRKDVLKELNTIFRGNRSIKKAAAVKLLRRDLNPACVDKTLENLFDKWKATKKRLFSKRN